LELDKQLKQKDAPMIRLNGGSMIPSSFVSAPGMASTGQTADTGIKSLVQKIKKE
jgi:hypothetical protein